MAQKVIVGGTIRKIIGGKDLVNGTVYKKKHGKVLVGGTAYKIPFAKKLQVLISGPFDGTQSYVKANGKTLSSPGEYGIDSGSRMDCKVFQNPMESSIYFNGAYVGRLDYKWTLTKSVRITAEEAPFYATVRIDEF